MTVKITTLRTAAQQALEALESAEVDPHSSDAVYKAITALRAALAEPVQEPVAWMVYTEDGKSVCVTDNPADFIEWRSLPLYTAPPQRKPLSEEEIYSLFRTAGSPTAFTRAIERAHGIT